MKSIINKWGGKIKFRVKKMCLTRWDTSNRALQNLVCLFPVQLPSWSMGTILGGSCQIWILEYSPSYWVFWNGGHLWWPTYFTLGKITKYTWVKMPTHITVQLWWIFMPGGININRRAGKRRQATMGFGHAFGGVGSGSEAEEGAEGGFPASWEVAWIAGLWHERGMIPFPFLRRVFHPSSSSKRGLRCVAWGGLGESSRSCSSAEISITIELKLHLSDHFTNLQNLKKCAWY